MCLATISRSNTKAIAYNIYRKTDIINRRAQFSKVNVPVCVTVGQWNLDNEIDITVNIISNSNLLHNCGLWNLRY